MRSSVVLFIPIVLTGLLPTAAPVAAAETYHGTVVDAETKAPLEGAVVVVVWHRKPIVTMDGPQYFHKAVEALTDAEGKFAVDASPGIDWNLFTYVLKDPWIEIFKPGYGPFPVAHVSTKSETGQPLEGVVVLAYWIKYQASLAGWTGGKYYNSEEAVTEPDGRLEIQSRWTYTIPAFTKVSGPAWVIFKPGYREWRSRGTGEGFDTAREIVIELPPLKTREERLRFYRTLGWAPVVPPERTKSLDAAVKKERAYLGFRN